MFLPTEFTLDGLPSADTTADMLGKRADALLRLRVRRALLGRARGLDDLEAAKLPPCSTIFHLAGTLKDAMLPSLMYESFSKPIVPKAGGLISLRRLSSDSN